MVTVEHDRCWCRGVKTCEWKVISLWGGFQHSHIQNTKVGNSDCSLFYQQIHDRRVYGMDKKLHPHRIIWWHFSPMSTFNKTADEIRASMSNYVPPEITDEFYISIPFLINNAVQRDNGVIRNWTCRWVQKFMTLQCYFIPMFYQPIPTAVRKYGYYNYDPLTLKTPRLTNWHFQCFQSRY